MKKIFTLSLFSILLFFGCEQGSDITSPENVSNSIEILPDIPDSIEVIPWPYPFAPDTMFIPINLPPSVEPQLKVSKIIAGNTGGKIEIDYQYQDSLNNTISVWAQLNVKHDSFVGVEEIKMIINNEFGIISFYPHMVFNKPVVLDMIYTGVDLSGINPNSVDFVFQNYDGSTEQINYEQLTINPEEGKLILDHGELHHFSRYGWIR